MHHVPPIPRPDSPLVEWALWYAAQGWPVFPCNVDKSPKLREWGKKASTEPKTIESWWNEWPDASIGCPTGPRSGFWAFDIDLPAGPSSLAGFEAQHGKLPDTRSQTTGGGGTHYLFQWPERQDIRNSAGQLAPGIDVRGNGGYIILPPSNHPDGDAYAWNGSPLAPLHPAPQWLLDLISKCKRNKQPKSNQARKPSNDNYGAKALKDEAEKVCCASEGIRNDTLNQAAFSLGQLVAGGVLSKAEVENELSKAALAAGLSQSETQKTIASGLNAGMQTPRQPPVSSNQRTPYTATCAVQPQQEPRHPVSLPPLPLTSFPPACRRLLEAARDAFVVPIEVPAACLLALASTCLGRAVGIRAKEGWVEHANLFLSLVARSGMGKSPCAKAFFTPIHQREAQWAEEYRIELAAWEQAQDEYKKAKRDKKSTSCPSAAPPSEPPSRRQLYVDDATIESLTYALAGNPRGILWYRDELSGLLLDLDKYAGKDGATKTRLLSAYDSGPWKVSRINKARDAYIPHATVSVFGTVQPGVLRSLFSNQDAASGFMPRFLFVFAEQNTPQLWSDAHLSETLLQLLGQIATALLSLNPDGEEPTLLGFTPEARRLFIEWHDNLALRSWGTAETDHDDALASKLKAQALRLSLILHCLQWAVERPQEDLPATVGPDTIHAALELADWLHEHQKYAWFLVSASRSQVQNKPLEQRVKEALLALEGSVANGVLQAAQIEEVLNAGAEEAHKVHPVSIGRILSTLGMTSQSGKTGRYYHVDQGIFERIRTELSNSSNPSIPS